MLAAQIKSSRTKCCRAGRPRQRHATPPGAQQQVGVGNDAARQATPQGEKWGGGGEGGGGRSTSTTAQTAVHNASGRCKLLYSDWAARTGGNRTGTTTGLGSRRAARTRCTQRRQVAAQVRACAPLASAQARRTTKNQALIVNYQPVVRQTTQSPFVNNRTICASEGRGNQAVKRRTARGHVGGWGVAEVFGGVGPPAPAPTAAAAASAAPCTVHSANAKCPNHRTKITTEPCPNRSQSAAARLILARDRGPFREQCTGGGRCGEHVRSAGQRPYSTHETNTLCASAGDQSTSRTCAQDAPLYDVGGRGHDPSNLPKQCTLKKPLSLCCGLLA